MTSALLVALVLGQTLKLGPTGFACPAGYAIQIVTGTRDRGRCVAVAGSGGSGLPADPAACMAGSYVTDQNASGVLTCSVPPGTYTLPDAAAGTTGGVRLTGDLSGTATSPTVPGLASRSGTGACGANTWASTLNGAAAPTCTQPGFSNLSGTAGAAQLPAATAGAQGAIQLAGDLGGTAASPSVVDDSHAHTGTTVSGLDTGDLTTGTLPQARGGTGAGALTCTGTQKLTSNGTAYSCATDADTVYSLPAATASVLGGVRGTGSSLTCAAGTVASGFDASGTLQCVTDATGGGGGGMALPYVVAAQSFGGF